MDICFKCQFFCHLARCPRRSSKISGRAPTSVIELTPTTTTQEYGLEAFRVKGKGTESTLSPCYWLRLCRHFALDLAIRNVGEQNHFDSTNDTWPFFQ